MKVKNTSLLIKIILIVVGFAYGVGLGTIDFNICRDNWVEKKEVEE